MSGSQFTINRETNCRHTKIYLFNDALNSYIEIQWLKSYLTNLNVEFHHSLRFVKNQYDQRNTDHSSIRVNFILYSILIFMITDKKHIHVWYLGLLHTWIKCWESKGWRFMYSIRKMFDFLLESCEKFLHYHWNLTVGFWDILYLCVCVCEREGLLYTNF